MIVDPLTAEGDRPFGILQRPDAQFEGRISIADAPPSRVLLASAALVLVDVRLLVHDPEAELAPAHRRPHPRVLLAVAVTAASQAQAWIPVRSVLRA